MELIQQLVTRGLRDYPMQNHQIQGQRLRHSTGVVQRCENDY